jgi:hypothetical protein
MGVGANGAVAPRLRDWRLPYNLGLRGPAALGPAGSLAMGAPGSWWHGPRLKLWAPGRGWGSGQANAVASRASDLGPQRRNYNFFFFYSSIEHFDELD